MKVLISKAKNENWENVESLNYKLPGIGNYESVVYAKLTGKHGRVKTKHLERVYYILSGSGVFSINGVETSVVTRDVITVPANTEYDYWPQEGTTMEILLFMELWDN